MSCNFEFRVEKEKVALFLRNRCVLYICGEINDSFIENIIGRRQEVLENRHLNNSIQFVLKNTINFLNLTQRVTMHNEWSGKMRDLISACCQS